MKRKIVFLILLVAVMGLIWIFIRPSQTSGNVDDLLADIFTMPNENVAAYYDNIEAGKFSGESIEKIIDNEFGKYFNEKGLKSFVSKYCYTDFIASLANDINASVTTKDIKVKYNGNDFTFSLTLVVKDKDYQISGNGRLNDGKVEYFSLDNSSLEVIEEIRLKP